MEISTSENEEIVKAVSEKVSAALEKNKSVVPEQLLVYEVDYLVMETNSGSSYEQYFRWASVEQIWQIVYFLRKIKLDDVADITEQAIETAFPNGIPRNDEEKSNFTDWSDEQEEKLNSLFLRLEEQNGRITNVLAEYIRTIVS